MAKPEGIFAQLYHHPLTYHRARYYPNGNDFIIWVDVMPHSMFRPSYVRPMMRAEEPKMAFMAEFKMVKGQPLLHVYVKEWGFVQDNDWQLIATSNKYKGALDDWDAVFTFAKQMMRDGIGAVIQKIKSY